MVIAYCKKGDKIWTEGPWATKHYGIYLGYDVDGIACVVHNNKGTGVEVTSFDAFSSGNPVFLEQSAPDDPRKQEEIAQRALSLLGRQYDLISFNCEDLANYAQTGTAYSTQVFFWGAVGVGAAVLLGRTLQVRP
jgi:hypothetical protein